jgi:hypothetical protein
MNGTLTPEEKTELRKTLISIRDWEPGGKEIGFPVYQGEQVAAALLLLTMEHAMSGGSGG